MRVRCESTVVSVQRVTAVNAVEGHLAWGVLFDRDRVAVPGPLAWLHDVTVRFEVLLASARRDGRGAVERIAVDRAEVFGLRDYVEGAVAVLQLTRPAQHGDSRIGVVEEEAFAARVAEHHDIWRALEESGAVSPELRERRRQVLEQVVSWEEIARRDLVRDRLSTSPGDVSVSGFCCLIRACPPPCAGCGDPWW